MQLSLLEYLLRELLISTNTDVSSSYGISKRKWVPALLGAVALVLCVVMSLHSLSGVGLVGCAPGSSCDGVLGSRWSLILGLLPVSVLAAGLYLSFLICLFLLERADDDTAPLVWDVLIVISGAVAGSAVWFMLLQRFELGMFCKYCIAAHSVGLVLAVIMLVSARSCGVAAKSVWLSFAAGLALAGGLALFQHLTVDRNFYSEGHSEAELPDMSRYGFPMIGDAGAEKTFTLLYDYQCPHCKKVHEAVSELVSEYPGKYSFILCPTPLSNACNPYIPAGEDHFVGSCEMAGLALAVWDLEPELFGRMDSFLWDDKKSVNAYDFACGLVGKSRLDEWLSSDSSFKTLSHCFELFGRTNKGEKAGLPRIVCGQTWIIPEVSDSDGLFSVLEGIF